MICLYMTGRGNSDWLDNKSDYNFATYYCRHRGIVCRPFSDPSKLDWLVHAWLLGMMIAARKPSFIKRLDLNDIGSLLSAK